MEQKEVEKNKGGRPKEYTPEVLEELADDLVKWVDENVARKKKDFLLGDWCFQVGFSNKNFTRYAKENEKFKKAYEWAKQWQEHQVCKGALFNELNPKFAQFFLGCNHKWSTKEDVEDDEDKAKSHLELIAERLRGMQKEIDNYKSE